MSLVPAKCPECGGNVVVDSEKEAWICDFCKTPFIVEKAINTFNTINNITNNITNNNEIKADVVNVYENKSSEFVIKAGELIEYNGASMDVVIPVEVVTISTRAFRNSNIHSIEMHDAVKSIGQYTNCAALEHIKLPNGLKKIIASSFENCLELKEIIIPNSVCEIERDAFKNCKSLESIILPESLEMLDYGVFSGCEKLKYINIPNKVKRILKNTFYDCFSLEKVSFDEDSKLVRIDNEAFINCPDLRINSLPDSLMRIDEYAFIDCPNTRSIVQPFIDKTKELEKIEFDKQQKHREEIAIKCFVERIMKCVQAASNKCPFCGTDLSSWTGKCRSPYCDSYKRKPVDTANSMIEAIKKGRCPSCYAVLSDIGYDEAEGYIRVECPNHYASQSKCHLSHLLFKLNFNHKK